MVKNNLYYNNSRYYEDNTKELLCEGFYELSDGTKAWCLNGKRHREDGPAVEYSDGGKEWCLNGKRHREDSPACEWSDGTKLWYINGQRHRVDGPAVEYSDGEKVWYLNGELVYSQEQNNISTFKVSKEIKLSIIKYELSK
jgi:hypothetical protein